MLTKFLIVAFVISVNSLKPPHVSSLRKISMGTYFLQRKLCIAIIAATLQIPVLALPTQALDFPNSMQLGALPSKGEFIVVKATDAELKRLHVDSWSTWTSGDLKFKISYDTNEICYIDSGKFKITPDGGKPVTVQAGDFLTLPKGFKCSWDISEPVFKHWKEY